MANAASTLIASIETLFTSTKVSSDCDWSSHSVTVALARPSTAHMIVRCRKSRRIRGRNASSWSIG